MVPVAQDNLSNLARRCAGCVDGVENALCALNYVFSAVFLQFSSTLHVPALL